MVLISLTHISPLVRSINRVFQQNPAPFLLDFVAFHPVKADKQHRLHDPGLGQENRESLQDARDAMATLIRLFKDLKEMGRDRSTARLPMELGAMVSRITTLLRGHSALKHCHVVLDAAAPVALPVFPVLIDQVLINLLLNAADATEGRGRIEVRVRATGGEARLEVHDDGKGLPEGMEASLFKPFASTKPHGTGLGLVSVRECALAHGGRVEYARSPLGGAAFSVCLPLPSGRG